jgi:predicted CxxxxCH...CXXCH cytochrome family protein
VNDAQQIENPALHVDGKIQFAAGDCAKCHGSAENPAPPVDTSGNLQPSAIGVGAHQAHLSGGNSSRPLACGECHTVPASAESPGHVDGLPAEVMLTGVASAFGHQPSWDHQLTTCGDTHCHGPGSTPSVSPSWIAAAPLACTSCHGTPPPAPHPQITDCSRCHGDVVAADDVTITDRSRHVDGNVDVKFDSSSTACHGSTNPAPPFDLSGSSATSSPGVGAHQAHVLGSARARAVQCNECHVVPDDVFAPGHLDSSLPAELAFSGVAAAFGGTPSYAAGACTNTSCHGGAFPSGHASGGTNLAPSWTQVDGTQAACGSCHGLPPPGPHPLGSLNPICNACHQNVLADNTTFIDPSLHVNGVVDFLVP